MSPSTHYRLFRGRVFPVNHLQWFYTTEHKTASILHVFNDEIALYFVQNIVHGQQYGNS